MKLYASSYGLGNEPAKLQALFAPAAAVAIVTNALDFSSDLPRRASALQREIGDLATIGLVAAELDLRNYFGRKQALDEQLARYAGVWVVGGNTFILRRAMRYSGFDELLPLRARDFVYAGYSAGSCVLAPTLRGIDLIDPPEEVPDGYASEILWDGLGLLDYSIAPHFRSKHPDFARVELVVDYFVQHGMPYRALRDGEVIVVE